MQLSRAAIAVGVACASALSLGLYSSVYGQQPQRAAGAVTAFENARLITEAGAPIERGTLVIQGNRITAIGRAGEVAVPSGATRVDLTGKTVMPAIVDTHSHLGYFD